MKVKLHIEQVPAQVEQAILTNNLVAVNRATLMRSQRFIASKLSAEDYAELRSKFNVQLASVIAEFADEL